MIISRPPLYLVPSLETDEGASPLDQRLDLSEVAFLVEYIEDLLTTGHTPRQVLRAIEEVWAREV